jgi:hypothetical protein
MERIARNCPVNILYNECSKFDVTRIENDKEAFPF